MTRERESEPIRSARNRSARWPAASGPAVAAKTSAVAAAASGGGGGGGTVRALKALVVGMGVLIVAGTVALVAVVVQRAGGIGGGGAGAARLVDLALDQPEGSRIAGIAAAEGGALGVWVARPDGDRVLLVDPRRGRVAGEIRLGAEARVTRRGEERAPRLAGGR